VVKILESRGRLSPREHFEQPEWLLLLRSVLAHGSGLRLVHRRVQMLQGLRHGERIHLASHAFSGFECGLQKMPGDGDGERVSDDLGGVFLIFIPRHQRQSDPDRPSINQKLDVHGIGMPGGHGDNQRLINAVDLLLGPAIEGMKVAIHGNKTISTASGERQLGQ
jgi:hypothetical protein